jgi:hypothetical protein
MAFSKIEKMTLRKFTRMKKILRGAWLFVALFGFVADASAQTSMKKDPMKRAASAIDTFWEGCNKELKTYCAAVKPGEGRIVACLYAHSDKISGQCEFALYEAAIQLDRAISGIVYVATQCRQDIGTHCAGVKIGDGRIVQCLKQNAAKLKSPCNQALKDVNLK